MDSVYYDNINLKEFPEIITNYLRASGSKKLSNVRKYYCKLLECVSDDIKDSYLNRILKYLSASTFQNITIIDDFNDGIYDKEIKEFANILFSELNKTNDFDNFIKNFNSSINIPFFSVEEYNILQKSFKKKEFVEYFYMLIKHSFKNYKISLPNISSQRMLEEALTIYFDTEFQLKFINESAKLGNQQAIVLYGNLNYSNPDKSLKYYLMAKKNKIALWEIGYMLETLNLKPDLVSLIKKELEFCFKEDSFLKNIKFNSNNENIKYAFYIYYYICCNYEYSKAYNSIGKLFLNKTCTYNDDKKKTNEYIKKYLYRAIELGNINALRLLSMYYKDNNDDPDYNKQYVEEILRKSADMGEIDANYEYGMLIKESNPRLAKKYLTYAANQRNSNACFELAQMNELKSDYNNAIYYYKKSIYYGNVNAVYDLCILYIDLSISSDKKVYIHKARQIFNKYKNQLSKENIDKINEIMPK